MRGFLNFYVDTAINHSGGGGNTPSFNLKITNWSWEILDFKLRVDIMTTPTHPLLMAVNISWVFCHPILRIAGTSRHLFRIVSLSKLRSVRNLPGSRRWPMLADLQWVGGCGAGEAAARPETGDWDWATWGRGLSCAPPPPRQHAPAQARQSDVTNTRRYTYSIFEYQHSEKDLLKIFELVSFSNFGTLPHKKDKRENIYSTRKM